MKLETELLKYVEKFKATETNLSPNAAGFYAWYAVPRIGQSDYQKNEDGNGKDFGESLLRELLAGHTEKFKPSSLKIVIKNNFRDKLEGSLSPIVFDDYIKLISGNSNTEDESQIEYLKAMNKVFKNEKQRHILSTVLSEYVTPFFSAPIYIGKAKNLNNRLKSHSRWIDKVYNMVSNNSGSIDTLREKVFSEQEFKDQDYDAPQKFNNFASRAIASGFTPENLVVYTFNISEYSKQNLESSEDLAISIEWFLNTWFRPQLGKK